MKDTSKAFRDLRERGFRQAKGGKDQGRGLEGALRVHPGEAAASPATVETIRVGNEKNHSLISSKKKEWIIQTVLGIAEGIVRDKRTNQKPDPSTTQRKKERKKKKKKNTLKDTTS